MAGAPQRIVFGDRNYGVPQKARKATQFLLTQQTVREFPDLYTGASLDATTRISDANPQETFDYVVGELNRFDLAFLDILQGTGGAPQAEWLPFDYARLRAIYKGRLILNNGYDFASAQQAITAGAADAIAFGRALLANPDLVERFRRGAPLNQPDYERLYVGEAKGYTDYPFLPA